MKDSASALQRPLQRVPLPTGLLPAGVLLAVAYAYPLARLTLESLIVAGQLSVERYVRLVQTPVFSLVVLRTLRIAVLVTVISFLLGYPLAYVLSRLPRRLAEPLLALVTVPFFTSVLIRTYAWVVILGNNGLVNSFATGIGLFSEPLPLVHNEMGVLIGMVQIQLPLMVFPLYSVMRGIDRSLVHAAQSLGANPANAFCDVFWPLSIPGVAAGASLVLVTSLGFFVTPALLGGPGEYLIAQSIETRMTTLVDFGAATAQATVLLVSVLGLMFVFRRPLGLSLDVPDQESPPRPRGLRTARPAERAKSDTHFSALLATVGTTVRDQLMDVASAVRQPVLAVVSTTTLAYLVLPMAVVVPLAFSDAPYLTFPPPAYSLRWFRAYLSDPSWLRSTVFSLLVASFSAIVATALGTLAAFPLVRSRLSASSFIYLIYVSPLIVPHMVLAVALFFVLGPVGLVGNPIGLISAYTVLGLPYVVVVLTAVLRRFDTSVEQAAASLGASPARVLISIILPLLKPAMMSAFLFAFLAAFDDVVVALFLSGTGAITLPIRMWEDIRLEISPRIAAVSVLLLAATVCALFLTRGSAMRWKARHEVGSE